MKCYFKTFLWTLVILILSFIRLPQTGGLEAVPHFDKLVHLILYLLLGLIMLDEVRNKKIVLVYIIILSAGIEIGQEEFTSYRSGDYIDFLAGIIGGVLGLYFKDIINRIK